MTFGVEGIQNFPDHIRDCSEPDQRTRSLQLFVNRNTSLVKTQNASLQFYFVKLLYLHMLNGVNVPSR